MLNRGDWTVMAKTVSHVGSMLLALATILLGADTTGKWVAEMPGRAGGPPRQITFNLKVDGNKLTGTYGIGGGTPPTVISFGSVDGDKIAFTVKRETPNGMIEAKYNGKVSGDELKLKVTVNDQERERRVSIALRHSQMEFTEFYSLRV